MVPRADVQKVRYFKYKKNCEVPHEFISEC